MLCCPTSPTPPPPSVRPSVCYDVEAKATLGFIVHGGSSVKVHDYFAKQRGLYCVLVETLDSANDAALAVKLVNVRLADTRQSATQAVESSAHQGSINSGTYGGYLLIKRVMRV